MCVCVDYKHKNIRLLNQHTNFEDSPLFFLFVHCWVLGLINLIQSHDVPCEISYNFLQFASFDESDDGGLMLETTRIRWTHNRLMKFLLFVLLQVQ
jgi:hypothetical protein